MRRRVMMVLASAALAGSVLAADAQAHGGGGRGGGGVGHRSGFGGAHIGARGGGLGGVRVGGIGGHYSMAGIPRGAVGYTTGAGYGTGIRYGTGILRGRFSVLSAAAFAQTATPDASTGADVTAPAIGAVQDSPAGGPSSQTGSGPGFTLVGSNGVSRTTAGMTPTSSASAPSSTQNQAAPAFRSGSLVQLRSGGPLMTVKGIKGDQVDCFWSDANGQINADTFPADVLQLG